MSSFQRLQSNFRSHLDKKNRTHTRDGTTLNKGRIARIDLAKLVLLGTFLILVLVQSGTLAQSSSSNSPSPNRVLQTGPLAPSGTYFDHLVFIIMENEGIDNICGSSPTTCNGSNSPYMSSLARNFTIDEKYLSLVGTSEPNYVGILGASTQNCTSSCGTGTIHAKNLVDRFETAGLTWRAYMEDQTPVAGCDNSDHGFYEIGHNGFIEFNDIDTSPTRCSNIRLANPAHNSTCTVTDCQLIHDLNSASPPNFLWLTPNDCDNMHAASGCPNGCTSGGSNTCIQDGDNYLKSLVPNILNSNTFKTTRSALFITFDEGMGFCPLTGGSQDCMYADWSGPAAKTNDLSDNQYNHYSFTKTIETNWSLATLTSNDAAATAMTEFLKTPTTDFSITASTPAPVDKTQSTTSTITIAALNGFTGTVSLTDTVPSGLTCGSIMPNSIVTSGTASVSCSSTTTGNYTLTVTGTSGTLVHSANTLFQFTDFQISATTPSPTNAGTSATSTITITSLNHYAGTVSLSDTIPTGLTCGTISPNSITASGTATVSCNSSTAGNYTLTLIGTSTPLTHNATITIRFQDFSLTATLSTITVNANILGNSTITVAPLNGFTRIVALTETTNSTNLSCSLTSTRITGSGASTLSCSSNSAGNYQATVTAKNNTLTHTVIVTFHIQDYTITASSLPADVGSSPVATITVSALNGFNGNVTLTDSLPLGLVCGTITPHSLLGPGSATVSCTANTIGNYTLTVTGTNLRLIHSTNLLLQFQDFQIATSTPSPSNAGSSQSLTITVTSENHFAGTINLSDTVPSGLSCGTITPGTLTGSGTATVSCSASTAGNYTLTLTGASTPLTHNSTVTLNFQDFSLTASSASITVDAGIIANSTLTVARINGFSGIVTLTTTTNSTSLSCSLSSTRIAGGAGTSTLSCQSTIAGNYLATVTAHNNTLTHTVTVTFQIQDFTIASTSPQANVGSSALATITISALNGFFGNTTLTDNPAVGLSCNPITPHSLLGSGSATVACKATAVGNYTLTIAATSGSLNHTVTSNLQFQDFTVSATNPSTVDVGVSTNTTITIIGLNNFSGTIQLTDSPPMSLNCGPVTPSSLAGSGTATINCSSAIAGSYSLSIAATSTTLTHRTTIIFQTVDFMIAGTPPSLTSPIGTNSTTTITLTSLNSYSGNINLTAIVQTSIITGVDGSGGGGILRFAPPPSQPTVSLNPFTVHITNGGSNQSIMTISISLSVPAGSYPVTLIARDGTITHTAQFTIFATDFTMTTSTSLSIPSGSTANQTLILTSLNGFQGNITLTTSIMPATGLSATLNPSIVDLTSLSNSTLTITGQTVGTYTLTIHATSGTLTHALNITVTVTGGPGMALARPFTNHLPASASILTLLTSLAILAVRRASTRTRYNAPKRRFRGTRWTVDRRREQVSIWAAYTTSMYPRLVNESRLRR